MTSIPRFVVDASVAIKWMFDDEDHTALAREVLVDYQHGQIDLIARGHLYHEVINALRTGVRMQRVAAADAEGAVRDFLELAIPTVEGPLLFIEGFKYALSFEGALYDGLYLALADQADCPLLHADRRLRNTLQSRFENELWIGDWSTPH